MLEATLSQGSLMEVMWTMTKKNRGGRESIAESRNFQLWWSWERHLCCDDDDDDGWEELSLEKNSKGMNLSKKMCMKMLSEPVKLTFCFVFIALHDDDVEIIKGWKNWAIIRIVHII